MNDYVLIWSDTLLKDSLIINPKSLMTGITSLSLFGKGYVGWGEMLQENMLHILENFASNGKPPAAPTTGQLWYDVTANRLKLWITDTWFTVWPMPIWINNQSGGVGWTNSLTGDIVSWTLE